MKTPKWISISEKLPEVNQRVLVCYDTVVFMSVLERYTKECKQDNSLIPIMVTEEWFFWKDYVRYKTVDGVVTAHSSLGFPTVKPIEYWMPLFLPKESSTMDYYGVKF